MTISVLIPTRGRLEGLRAAISTMVERARQPGELEFLLRSDDDLPAVREQVPVGGGKVVELRGPRGAGYRDVYKMYNQLAAAAAGAWLISWNDDVEMLTSGWDDLVRQAHPHSVQFFRRDILDHADTTFPCTGRSVYEAMGHIALQVHADDWLGYVARDAGVAVFCDDIVFHHHRFEDQTSWERDHGGYDTEGFHSPEMRELRAVDVERVKATDPRRAR